MKSEILIGFMEVCRDCIASNMFFQRAVNQRRWPLTVQMG